MGRFDPTGARRDKSAGRDTFAGRDVFAERGGLARRGRTAGWGGLVRLGGFTLIELLVVIAVIAVLISIIMPALSAARNEGVKAKCLANLKQLGSIGAAYAADHPDSGAMLAMPPWSKERPDDSGIYDYGGGAGCQDGNGVWGYQANGRRPPGARPLNRYVLGPRCSQNDDFRMFQCPGDVGWVDAPFYATDTWPSQWKLRPFFESTGTSYRANAARAMTSDGRSMSMSPYARPISRVPAPSETILYSESIHWLARWNTVSASEDPRQGTNEDPATIPGWHGQMGRFNIGFVDGHASMIVMDMFGMDPGLGVHHPLDPEESQLWSRGPGPQRWRIDIRREALIDLE